MPESQALYPYTAASIESLKGSLSEKRYQTYRNMASNEEEAFALYIFNAEISKSLLFPLSVVEVTIRNAVDNCIIKSFGENWHDEIKFRRLLNEKSLSALDKAIEVVGKSDHNKVVAQLTFDFWSNLFRDEYSEFWRTRATVAFPNLPHGEGRSSIKPIVKSVNWLRNRIAHHEPVFQLNIIDEFNKIKDLINYKCSSTLNWMVHYSNVDITFREGPEKINSYKFFDKSDHSFNSVDINDLVSTINFNSCKKSDAFVCYDNGIVVSAFTKQQLMNFILEKSNEQGGIIDLSDYKILDVVSQKFTKRAYRIVEDQMSWFEVINIMQGRKADIVVGVNQAQIASCVLLRSHRRY